MTENTASASCSVEYNWLGNNAGIKVSNLCLGAMTFGEKSIWEVALPGNTDEAKSHAILDKFAEHGGNFIDTANTYSSGESEEIIGTWMSRRKRSDFIIATKLRFHSEDLPSKPSNVGLSRSAILHNLDESLKRLNTDYIDLYYMHGWDEGAKLEETLRTFNDVVRSGKVRYVGCSNLYGWQMQKIVDYNKFMGFDQFAVLQQEYSLLARYSEPEVFPACADGGIGLIPYSALKGGLLTGKFQRNKNESSDLAGSRLAWVAEKPEYRTRSIAPHIEQYREDENYWALMDSMASIAKVHGKTRSQVAIRWLLQKPGVCSVLIGAKTIAQLEDNLGAGTGWKLSDEEMDTLNKLSDSASPSKMDVKFLDLVSMSRRRVQNTFASYH